jgi:hypothetical protein
VRRSSSTPQIRSRSGKQGRQESTVFGCAELTHGVVTKLWRSVRQNEKGRGMSGSESTATSQHPANLIYRLDKPGYSFLAFSVFYLPLVGAIVVKHSHAMSTAPCPPQSTKAPLHKAIISRSWKSCCAALPVRGSSTFFQQAKRLHRRPLRRHSHTKGRMDRRRAGQAPHIVKPIPNAIPQG